MEIDPKELERIRKFNESISSGSDSDMVFTKGYGVTNPQGVGVETYSKKLAEEKAAQDISAQKTDMAKKSPLLLSLIKEYIASGGDLKSAEEQLKLSKDVTDSPQFSALVLNDILIPSMLDYSKTVEPKEGFERILYGLARSVTPNVARPDTETRLYKSNLKALKNLIAKGLIGNIGNPTTPEQEDPLEMFPSDWDSPDEREDRINNVRKLLQNYGQTF